MSAFYDIWISRSAEHPRYKRSSNREWEKQEDNIWLSLPEKNTRFIKEIKLAAYSLIVIGQLYEQIDDRELLKRCTDYIEYPNKGFQDPAGHYIIFVTDETRKETYVFTNRLGTYHAYWSADNMISTCYLGLAKAKTDKKLDWKGITGFMAIGYFPDDRTYLEGISIFEPASCYRFDEQLKLIEKNRYWQWQYEPKIKPVGNYTEPLHTILRSSLSVAVQNRKTVIPLSGGLDSRLLAGELTAGDGLSYENLKALSYGFTDQSPEIKIAREIAACRNIPIYAYRMPDYLFQQLEEITEVVELFQYVDGTRQASVTGWLSENADIVIGGHWGDVWMDSMNVHTDEELNETFRKKVIKKGADWLLEHICNRNLGKSHDYLQDYFSSFMNKYQHIHDADFRMKIYKTEQWSARWTTASIRMYQSASFPVLPFYDKRIVDLFCTIPTDIVKDRNLQVTYLKQYHSDLAKITWQEYDANLYSYKYFNNRNIGYRVVDKIRRAVSTEQTIQRNWEVFYLHPEGRKNLEQILLGNKLLNDIVPETSIKQLLDDLYDKPGAANGYTVSMLLTFTIFLNKVFT